MSGKLINHYVHYMNIEFEVLADWFHANKLSLNVSKIKHMLFSRSYLIQREDTVVIMYDKTV